jgi:uroporphyrinogen-III synthase
MALMIWTRSADDWEHDKPILEATDVDVLHLPCIAMTGLPVKFPKRKPQMFIFTSANAVRYSSRHPALFNLMRTSEGVLAVGPGTKESLKSHKINAEVPPGVSNAEQLTEWMAHNLRPGTDVAWPCSKDPNYDIAGTLARYDIQVDPLPVYATEKCLHLPHGKAPDADDIERYIQSLEGVVCFASPSAIDGFARSLNPSENRLRHELIACCIGQTTAAFAEGHFDKILIAPTSTIESLVEIAAKALAE